MFGQAHDFINGEVAVDLLDRLSYLWTTISGVPENRTTKFSRGALPWECG